MNKQLDHTRVPQNVLADYFPRLQCMNYCAETINTVHLLVSSHRFGPQIIIVKTEDTAMDKIPHDYGADRVFLLFGQVLLHAHSPE